MPDLGIKLHLRRLIRVVTRDLDVNDEGTALIGGVVRTFEEPLPMGDVISDHTA
jgi:hypothetical protein